MKVSKDYLLNEVYHLAAWGKKYQELNKRLPDQVELTEDFVKAHAVEFAWGQAIRLLLEGEHMRRAFERETEAATALAEALKKRESDFPDGRAVHNVVAYEKAGDDAYEAYDCAVALAFAEELRAQGGLDINRMRA
jgi:hypothetical protein